jgi:PadR family transcriptional regulator AphA
VSLRAAILGFLELEPMTGYTLKQRFEGSVGSFWSATQSQIYRELHALEADGLVVVRRERGDDGKPDRKVYANTPAGRDALEAWLLEPLEPLQLRHPLLLKFVFSSETPPAALDAILAKYQAGLEAVNVEYRARLAAKEIFALARSPREAEIWRLSLEHGLAWCEVETAWVTKARHRLGGTKRRKEKT